MEQENANSQGYHDDDGCPQQKRGSRPYIRDEPAESADVRHQENSQPNLEIGANV